MIGAPVSRHSKFRKRILIAIALIVTLHRRACQDWYMHTLYICIISHELLDTQLNTPCREPCDPMHTGHSSQTISVKHWMMAASEHTTVRRRSRGDTWNGSRQQPNGVYHKANTPPIVKDSHTHPFCVEHDRLLLQFNTSRTHSKDKRDIYQVYLL